MILIIGNESSVRNNLCEKLRANGFFAVSSKAKSALDFLRTNKFKIVILFSADAASDEKLCAQIKNFDQSIVIVSLLSRELPSRYLNVKNTDYQFFLPLGSTEIVNKLHFIYMTHFNLSFSGTKVGTVSNTGGKIFIHEIAPRLTKSEEFILKFCLYNYPDYISAKSIAEFGGISQKSVPAIVSTLNKKSADLLSFPIIKTKRFRGYALNYIK